MIESRAIDVMVSVGPNMFYTVTLPCTLWFFDKGKKDSERSDKVLFIDARHVYRQLDRAHRDWTPQQIEFLANIARLYRGEPIEDKHSSSEMLPSMVLAMAMRMCPASARPSQSPTSKLIRAGASTPAAMSALLQAKT